MKATFERVGKRGPGHHTLHLNKKSKYHPPEDFIEHVEKDGHSILIEQTLDGAQFEYIFSDIIKHLQEEPRKPFPNSPKSLLLTSSLVAGQNLKAKVVAKNAAEIIENLAVHLQPNELADFVNKNKTIAVMRQQFTNDGIQRFLLHFFKTYQRADLKPWVKLELKKAKKAIYHGVYQMAADVGGDALRHQKLDWVLTALGCFQQLYQFHSMAYTEWKFFSLKFRFRQEFGRYPIPKIPFSMKPFIPDTDFMLVDITPLDSDEDFNNRLFTPKGEKYEQFMLLLRAFEEATWRGSHNEVLAYAAQLLDNDDMAQHSCWGKYFLYIWGGLAVTCAELHLPFTVAFSCLNKMTPLVKCISNEIDLNHYTQQVHAAYGRGDEEERLFSTIMDVVSKHSAFFMKATVVHMSAKKREIEDMLMQAYAKRQVISDSAANVFFKMDIKKNRLNKYEDKIVVKCNKLVTLMHTCCSLTCNKLKRNVFNQEIAIIELYLTLLERIKNPVSYISSLNKLDANLKETKSHCKHFVAFWNKSIDFDQYIEEMNKIKVAIQRNTRIVNHQAWADVGYVHLLMFKVVTGVFVVGNNLQEHTENLYTTTHDIYAAYENPRAERLEKNYTLCEEYDTPTYYDLEQVFAMKTDPTFSIFRLVKGAPQRVKALIRQGISSVERFDVCVPSKYWTQFY